MYSIYPIQSANANHSLENTMMKTVVCPSPGALELVERPVPQAAAGEVLLRVRRIGLCGTDMHIFRGTQPFL